MVARQRAILVPYEPERSGNQDTVADSLAFGHVRSQRLPRRGADAAGEQDIRRSDAALVSPSGEGKFSSGCNAGLGIFWSRLRQGAMISQPAPRSPFLGMM